MAIVARFCGQNNITLVSGFTTFRDFSQARNEGLELARKSELDFDYILLADADMELVARVLGNK